MEDTTGFLNGGLRAWINKTGFPVAISLLLMGLLYTFITQNKEIDTETNAILKTHMTKEDTQTKILRALCQNAAKNEFQAANCNP